MFHFCHEELFGLMMLIPGLKVLHMRILAHRAKCREAKECPSAQPAQQELRS